MTLPPDLTARLTALAQDANATLFMALLALFETLLHRWSGQDDFIVGFVTANRDRVEIEDLAGFFVNTIPVRARHNGEPTFRDVLDRVREESLAAYAHRELPFEKLIEDIGLPREAGRDPLVRAVLAFEAQSAELTLPGVDTSPFHVETATTQFELALLLAENDGGITGTIRYSSQRFAASTIQRMAQQYLRLACEAIADPDRRIADLDLLDEHDRRVLLDEWSGRQRPGLARGHDPRAVRGTGPADARRHRRGRWRTRVDLLGARSPRRPAGRATSAGSASGPASWSPLARRDQPNSSPASSPS